MSTFEELQELVKILEDVAKIAKSPGDANVRTLARAVCHLGAMVTEHEHRFLLLEPCPRGYGLAHVWAAGACQTCGIARAP